MSGGFVFEEPTRVTVGTLGPVGERLFVLQARQGSTTVTVKVEKVQVASLAAYLGRMLRELDRPGHLPGGDELGLEEFVDPDFSAEALALSYDETADRVVLVIDEVDPTDGVEAEPGAAVRLSMTREQAAALAIRATELVEAGRPPCPLCGYPLDPRGHSCPRTNGHRAPLT